MIVNAIAVARHGSWRKHALTADTIMKLDSVKDKRLLRVKDRKNNKRSAAADTTKKDTPADTTKKNKGGLQSVVKSVADDSTYTDADKKITYLFGNARVTYEDFSLDADFIRIDQKQHLIFARGTRDMRTGRYINRPIAKNGNENPLTADSIIYNFKTKKAYSYNTSTESDGNFITGGEAKRLNDTEVAYHNILFSTCSMPYPHTHFGVVITKGIGEKNRIISGPAYLEIAGVPLPIAVPFGFFPKPNSRASGVLLPSFGEDARLGFFLRNFGYYWPVNDYLDLTTMASVYSKGSVEIGTTARYLKRYKYTGSMALNFGSHNYGVKGDPSVRDYNIQWTHSQDANANPGTTFSASVNAATSSYYANNPATTNYNIQQLTQASLRSSISYARTFQGTPFSLNVSLGHSQDIANKTVTLELPTFNFNMTSLSPFDSKNRVGEQKWYQRLTVSYTMQGTNKINAVPESQLFTRETLTRRMQNGIQHQIPIGLNLNVFKYFQFNTSANYNERWYFQTIRKRYPRGAIGNNEQPLVDTVQGFSRAGEYSLNGGFSTKVYNTLQFKGNGALRAIRHVMTPSLSFNYRPDFGDPAYGYFRRAVSDAVVPYPATSQLYSIYERAVYGGPSAGKFAGISFALDNTIEAKMRARSTDTSGADRKVSLLQGLSLNTSYNFAVDSFRLSPISLNAHTALFNQKVSVSMNGTLDPYVTERRDSVSNGALVPYIRRIDRYTFQNGRFPALTNLSASVSFSLNSQSNKPKPPTGQTLQNMTPQQAQQLALLDSDPSRYVDFNVPYNVSVNFNFNYSNTYVQKTTSSTVSLNGDVNVSPKWKVQYTTNYDFKAKQVGITQFSIYRDLHCWDLSFRWTPFGLYKSFSVDLRVKASILQDLKLSKRKDYYNN
ncbi:putative LPS assembly protein LptD [Mucilaginibacter aquatilis]|uniref:LPS-assembly protein LptD n=1 Tax=Mucilaginibacter aquatilis TaxID=1517760 RepID=A0A6I4I855_9SPHI|nr:putative LPS assembly protein LptD [Mucilaginibacter aquatilis]MVN89649.1 LPS-assembly protein LptD [Mucilaginibacter aquatilis]